MLHQLCLKHLWNNSIVHAILTFEGLSEGLNHWWLLTEVFFIQSLWLWLKFMGWREHDWIKQSHVVLPADWNLWTTAGWVEMKLCTNYHGPQRMNPNDLGCHLTSSRSKFLLFLTYILYQFFKVARFCHEGNQLMHSFLINSYKLDKWIINSNHVYMQIKTKATCHLWVCDSLLPVSQVNMFLFKTRSPKTND